MHRESPARRGATFLPIEGGYRRDPLGRRLVHEREKAVEQYRLKEVGDDTAIMTFRLGRTYHDQIDRTNGDIETQHRVNFFEHITRRLMERQDGKRFRVLVLGSGMGLFNDELRAEFGKKIDVKGISLVNEGVLRRQKEQLRHQAAMGTGPFEGDTASKDEELGPRRERVQQVLREGMGTRKRAFMPKGDAKWSSILDMRDYPEFDLMVDTFDELYYASREAADTSSDHPFEAFDAKLRAACRKLLPGGELFIARLHHEAQAPERSALAHVWESIPRLQREEGVRVFIGGVAYEEVLAKLGYALPLRGDPPSFEEAFPQALSEADARVVDGSPPLADRRDGRTRLPERWSSLWYKQARVGTLPIKIVRDEQLSSQKSTAPVVSPEVYDRLTQVSSPWKRVEKKVEKVTRWMKHLFG